MNEQNCSLKKIHEISLALFTGVRGKLELAQTSDELLDIASTLACGVYDILQEAENGLTDNCVSTTINTVSTR